MRDFDLLSATLQIRCPNPEGITPVRFAIGSPTDELLDALGEPFITQETRFRPDLVEHLFLDQRNGNVTMYGVTAESVEYLGVGIRTWVDAEEGCV